MNQQLDRQKKNEASDNDNEVVIPKQSTLDSAHTKVKTLPASVKKLEQDSGDSSESSSDDQSKTQEGFRFVDIAILRAVFVSSFCPLCRYGHIVFDEDQNSKKDFATLLVLKCAPRKCKYSRVFILLLNSMEVKPLRSTAGLFLQQRTLELDTKVLSNLQVL